MLKNIFTAGARSFRRDSPRFLCVSLHYLSTSAVKIFFLVHHQFFILLLFIILFSACRSPEQATQSENVLPTNEESFNLPVSNINLAKPLEISNKPEDAALAKKIEEMIEKSEFANARRH